MMVGGLSQVWVPLALGPVPRPAPPQAVCPTMGDRDISRVKRAGE